MNNLILLRDLGLLVMSFVIGWLFGYESGYEKGVAILISEYFKLKCGLEQARRENGHE